MDVQPFKIEVHDEVLDHLRRRLETIRWPDEIPNSGWDYGSTVRDTDSCEVDPESWTVLGQC